MLLLSVDVSYATGEQVSLRTRKREEKIFKKRKLDWPNIHVPEGWTGVKERFNLNGYGLTLIDAEGIVRGIGIHSKQLDELLARLYPNVPESNQD